MPKPHRINRQLAYRACNSPVPVISVVLTAVYVVAGITGGGPLFVILPIAAMLLVLTAMTTATRYSALTVEQEEADRTQARHAQLRAWMPRGVATTDTPAPHMAHATTTADSI